MRRMVLFAPRPTPAVHGVGRGTVNSLVSPDIGHPSVFTPRISAIFRPTKDARLPPASTAEFFASAICARLEWSAVPVVAPAQPGPPTLGSEVSLLVPR